MRTHPQINWQILCVLLMDQHSIIYLRTLRDDDGGFRDRKGLGRQPQSVNRRVSLRNHGFQDGALAFIHGLC